MTRRLRTPAIKLALRFAVADLWHDRKLTLLGITLLAALLAPPVVLHTLRVGLVETWARDLATDLRNREVVIVGEHEIDASLLAALRAWPETGFAVPEPSFFVTTQIARLVGARGSSVSLDMRTTSRGDPVLARADLEFPGQEGLILSRHAATELEAAVGSEIGILLQRTPSGGAVERREVILRVAGVLPETVWQGRTGFVSEEMLLGFSRYLTFSADAPQATIPDASQRWQSLRVYAPEVALAPALRDRLEEAGLDTRLMTDQVDRILRLETGLRQLFGLVLGLSALAFGAATILIQWLSVLRKRRDFALMTVVGMSRSETAIFPLFQGAVMTAFASTFALGLVAATGGSIEAMAQGYLAQTTEIVRPALAPVLAGALCVVALGGLAGAAAVVRLGQLDVSRALRGD
ncbi:putative ABC transport system permease protein [Roseovarius sp. MBR-79]|jgi:putative ABC transport system permease protein